eukprot:scaffold1616_cov395-Prasinococcus_capsulatus_cf.AAC.4
MSGFQQARATWRASRTVASGQGPSFQDYLLGAVGTGRDGTGGVEDEGAGTSLPGRARGRCRASGRLVGTSASCADARLRHSPGRRLLGSRPPLDECTPSLLPRAGWALWAVAQLGPPRYVPTCALADGSTVSTDHLRELAALAPPSSLTRNGLPWQRRLFRRCRVARTVAVAGAPWGPYPAGLRVQSGWPRP